MFAPTGSSAGGALYLKKVNGASIVDTDFLVNHVQAACTGSFSCSVVAQGGGLYVGAGNVAVTRSTFVSNQSEARNNGCYDGRFAQGYGAGISVAGGDLQLTNVIASCNSVAASGSCQTTWAGAALYVGGGTATLTNATLARNTNAAALHCAAGTVQVQNSILYFNNAGAAQISGTCTTVTYSDLQGGFSGEGNIPFDPAFPGVGCTEADLAVVNGSSAIDGGNPDPSSNDVCFPPSRGGARNDMGYTGGPGACPSP